jgi:hypothetical protein
MLLGNSDLCPEAERLLIKKSSTKRLRNSPLDGVKSRIQEPPTTNLHDTLSIDLCQASIQIFKV